ncbi:MAG: hypothetical protein IJT44_05415 [Clostridia bacterium]|nr:hypothetical protein [Clostridia bacterium]
MKRMKKILCAALCAALLTGSVGAFTADAGTDTDYTILNPYADVDWNAAAQYKTALHTHTNASDGSITLRESLETHVLQGFDIVATTDHGIDNGGWEKAEDSNYQFIHGFLQLIRRTEGELDYLGESGTFACGLPYTLTTADNGDDYLKVQMDDGTVKEVMRLPHGIENNALSINAHVNSWFVPYHDNTVTDYLDALRGVTKAGGVCVINHPGEYTKAKSDLTSEQAYDLNDPVYRYYINRYYGMLQKYPACIGIDMNSKGDGRTRYDRELWDILLERSTPGSRNIFAICSSDAHQKDKINTGYVRLLMTEKTSEAARRSLESGAFFGCSYCNGNQKELENILENLEKYYGAGGDLYEQVSETVAKMRARVEGVENGTIKADAGPENPLRLVDKDGFFHGKDTCITSVAVDQDADTITVNTENALLVRWIADGEVIAVSKADGGTSTLRLDEVADKLGAYVRAEAFGEGGTVYTQPFVLRYDGQPQQQKYPYISVPVIDALFASVRTVVAFLGRAWHKLFK